jgi:pilus assembly protein CpaC
MRNPDFIFAIWFCAALIAGAAGAEAANGAAAQRRMSIPAGKSVILDLPAEVIDVVTSNPSCVEIVMRTARRVFITGMQPGGASAIFLGADGAQVLNLDITVTRDLAGMTRLINRLIPHAHVRSEAVNGDVALLGNVRQPADAARAMDIASRFAGGKDHVINMIEVALHEQVLLKVTIAEVQRGALKRLGVDIKQIAAKARGLHIAGASETAFPVTSGRAPASPGFDPETAVLGAPVSGGAIGAVWRTGAATVEALVESMERDNLVRTLAEPSLVSMSGETAQFLAGGEFPIPIARDGDHVSVEWKRFGVGLSFTPLVIAEGRISLKIETEVSDLSSEGAVSANGFYIPAIKVRRAASTLELQSGGSMVLAGLISQTSQHSAEGTPGLKSLPVLGALFESEDFAKSETELVIIVTPYIAKAAPRSALALPSAAPLDGWRRGTSIQPVASAARKPFSFFDDH